MVGRVISFEKNNADICSVAPLAARMPGEIIAPLIDKLTNLTNHTGIDVSVPNTALRTLIASLPQPQSAGISPADVTNAYTAISKVLIPRLVGEVVLPSNKPPPQLPPGLLEMHPDKGYSSDAVDVLIEVVKCYGAKLQEPELAALTKSVMAIVESPQAGNVVKKRGLAAVGALLTHFSDIQLSVFVSQLIESFRNPHLTPVHRRYLIATIGTLARATPRSFGPYLKRLAPFVLSAVSQEELDENAETSDDDNEVDPEVEELRETALVSLEALLASCTSEMELYMMDAVDSSLRYLKYDPNVAEADDENMGGTQDAGSDDDGITEEAEDEDDEYAELDDDDAFSDVDDVSWKVRRCAAKVLYAIVSASTISDHVMLFGRIAPALISRLNLEREENVKLEIIAAMAALVRKSGSIAFVQSSYSNSTTIAPTASIPIINTRKRRRQDSNASLQEFEGTWSPPIVPASPPTAGPQADLVALIPKTVQALTKMWKRASISLKQAAVTLLRSLALTRNGALADYLQQIEDPVADALKPSTAGSSSINTTSAASTTVASLQIETLSLISSIAETNSSSVLLPFVIALIPGVTITVRNRNFKVSGEALGAVEQFVKALTPPRLEDPGQEHATHLEKLYDVIVDRVTDNHADLEVRHRAIHVFGVLLARTSPTKLLSANARKNGLHILSERLKNETTRVSSARAVAILASASMDDVPSAWTRETALEMGAQLRKSDRALRGSCLDALRTLALNPVTAAQFDDQTIGKLRTLLLPLLTANDFHLLTPTLVIFTRIIPTSKTVADAELVKSLCTVVQTNLSGSALKAFLLVVKVIGEQRVGSPLMKEFLGVGTAGEALVVGRAIGTLVVYGGKNIGVSIDDFHNELRNSKDPKALCLALAVLGEIGYRMGSSSPLEPDTFVKSLESDSEKVRMSAAVALGSAGASNISNFLPLILERFGESVASDYLYLHAVKEILQHPDSAAKDIAPYAQSLWEKLFAACKSEDNKAVGAECIGRLALIDPNAYIPELQRYLGDSNANIRGTVVSAFRFTLGDVSATYNQLLLTTMVPLITTMLSDSNIENRREAVTTLNSAIHNKPELIVPDLNQLLPIVLADSYIKPELIKEVSFGPFKIKKDEGLELRKSCYETLYALLDTPAALPHLSITTVFDRILDGIPDEHDVRTLCQLMLMKLTHLDPDETRRRLSPLADKFKVVLGQKVKDNAVKQEIEKLNEANAGVIRTTMELDKNFPSAATDGSGELVTWKGYLEWVKKDFAALVRSIQDEGSA
jgi:cullin-associated NEDD8-dissociated protein 1